ALAWAMRPRSWMACLIPCGGSPRTSRLIGEALADDAGHDAFGASSITYSQGYARIVAEIKLGEVAAKVLLADVVVHAVDAALEDAEIAFDGVGVGIAAHVFLGAVVDDLMGEIVAKLAVHASVIGHDDRLVVNVREKDGAKVR